MAEHYRTLSAVFPVLFRQNGGQREVLLHRRANTGYMDGKWDFAGSGHVDEGETARMALIRECAEELSITVEPAGVQFAHLCHRIGTNGARTYYDIYFTVERFSGSPRIAEPEKCSGMEWFPLDSLPEGMIKIRSDALRAILDGIPYSEFFTN